VLDFSTVFCYTVCMSFRPERTNYLDPLDLPGSHRPARLQQNHVVYKRPDDLMFQKQHRPLSPYEATRARVNLFLATDPTTVNSREWLAYLTGTQRIKPKGQEPTTYPPLTTALITILGTREPVSRTDQAIHYRVPLWHAPGTWLEVAVLKSGMYDGIAFRTCREGDGQFPVLYLTYVYLPHRFPNRRPLSRTDATRIRANDWRAMQLLHPLTTSRTYVPCVKLLPDGALTPLPSEYARFPWRAPASSYARTPVEHIRGYAHVLRDSIATLATQLQAEEQRAQALAEGNVTPLRSGRRHSSDQPMISSAAA
jgi:hypothetical protein